MSRYNKTHQDQRIVYGFDHALGYFYEVWKNQPNVKFPDVDRCSMFGMPRSEMADALQMFDVNKEHIIAVALDLPF